jgi:hypothetical protein
MSGSISGSVSGISRQVVWGIVVKVRGDMWTDAAWLGMQLPSRMDAGARRNPR